MLFLYLLKEDLFKCECKTSHCQHTTQRKARRFPCIPGRYRSVEFFNFYSQRQVTTATAEDKHSARAFAAGTSRLGVVALAICTDPLQSAIFFPAAFPHPAHARPCLRVSLTSALPLLDFRPAPPCRLPGEPAPGGWGGGAACFPSRDNTARQPQQGGTRPGSLEKNRQSERLAQVLAATPLPRRRFPATSGV